MGCGASAKKYEADANNDAAGAKTEEKKAEDGSADKKVEETATEAPADAEKKKSEEETSSKSSEDNEDDVMDDAEFEKRMARASNRARKGISAERTEVDPNWKPPVFEKTPEQEDRLSVALSKCFMFSVLEPEQLATVIQAFQETPKAKGETVIQQGAEVSSDEPALFVIESGQLSVYKTDIEQAVFVYTKPGQYFGDLALLYNAPRAATVTADEEVMLWSIDRDTFNNLVKDAAQQQINRRMGFLQEVELLRGLTNDEKATLCDALQVRQVEAGTQIITQGDQGTEFFIVESGKCEARKGSTVVMTYEAKNFFGELALVKSAPRAADVVAVENSRLLVLGVEVFRRLLGPLEDILKERAEAYKEVDLKILQSESAGQ